MRERIAEVRALGGERRERSGETLFPLLRQPEMRDACVLRGLLTPEETGFLRAAHEPGDGALRQLQALGERRHRRPLAAVCGTPCDQPPPVTLRGQPGT